MTADETMRADDVRPYDVLRHGAYVCLRMPESARSLAAAAAVDTLAECLGLRNEFAPGEGEPPATIAYARRAEATPGQLEDEGLLHADALVHVSATGGETVNDFLSELPSLLPAEVGVSVLRGVLRPTLYTGNLLHNLAYAHRILQQPGTVMPNVFLAPMSKTPEWWRKGWMERHTYFLPRYDDAGNQVREGHALAASAGVASLLRRTYKNGEEPAPAGAYDFLNYFECADDDVPVFHAVRASLRDLAKNPEWAFVREGPTWHGRRVARWRELMG